MRQYLKDLIKKPNFINFVKKQKDFLYIEDNKAIFASPRIIDGECKIALKMQVNGNFCFGSLIESCQNFEGQGGYATFFPSEVDWMKEKLEMVKRYCYGKKRK